MFSFLSFGISFLKRYEVFQRFLLVEEKHNVTRFPKEWHRVLHLDEKIKKVLFIGDVHGCYNELSELLKMCKFEERKEDMVLVFTGDLVNKGPMNVETVRFVRSLGKMAHSVRGNHEEAVLSRFRRLDEASFELPKNYFWVSEMSEEDGAFLEELPFSITIPLLNVIVIHGGLVPGVKLQEQLPRNMISMRNFIPEELTGTGDIDLGVAWSSQWCGPEFVVFGHDARRKLQKYRNAIGLDTGCVYGGALTGLLVNLSDSDPLKSGKFISVKANMMYSRP